MHSEVRVHPQVIFFPPNPPPLGTVIQAAKNPERSVAKATLSNYVAELFYPPISTRLSRGALTNPGMRLGLSGRQREWLAEFDQLRFQLVSELKTTLLLARAEGVDSRQAKLESLAQKQDQSLRALESISEQLRSDLARFGNWYSRRDWKLGKGRLKKPREQNGIFEFEVIRAAAFYQGGLSPPQRRLLRELAMERERTVLAAPGTPPLNERLIFFQPETSQFLLPDNLPADGLEAKIKGFQQAKNSLKQELADALYELDGVWFASKRERGLEELAARQQSRMNELEIEAEIIRQEFARIPGLIDRWEPSDPLPPQLQSKVERFLLPVPAWDNSSAPDLKSQRETLAKEILAELETLADANMTSVIGETLRLFLVDRERKTAYFFYANALFQPGMSPAQRRLLYNDAIRNLHLILPGREFQATDIPETLLY